MVPNYKYLESLYEPGKNLTTSCIHLRLHLFYTIRLQTFRNIFSPEFWGRLGLLISTSDNFNKKGNGKGTLLYFHHLKIYHCFSPAATGCVKIIPRLARILLKKRKNRRSKRVTLFNLTFSLIALN